MQKHLSIAILGSLALTSSASAQSFDYDDFSDLTGISPVGLTTQAVDILRLQDNVAPAAGGDNRGAAWYATPVSVVNGFETTFEYRMHTPNTTGGSDGMAFVIQNDMVAGVPMTAGFPDGTGNTALGRHASAAGFGVFTTSGPGESVDNSLAIHLDTFENGTWGDTDNNHVSVHTGGTGDNGQDEAMSLGRVSPATDLNLGGLMHTIRVLYVPGTLEVYLDGVLELSVAYDFTTGGTWVDSGTPVGGLNLIGGTSAYVGFTSGAGSAREFRDIHSWEFASGGLGSSFCIATPHSDGGPAQISASGSTSLTDDSVTLRAQPVPNQPGLFIFSANQQQTPFCNGFLCVGPGIIRIQPPAPAQGLIAERTIAPTSFGIGVGPTNFQYWFRDPAGGGAFCNLSNGLEITFAP